MGRGEHVLLTGLPSVRGKFVLRELLAREGVRVRALVHETDLPDVAVMLEGLQGLDARGRVDVVEGDPSAMDLGLSGAEFKSLAKDVTHIHHCAVTTYSAVDRDVALAVNVNGAREILELADACRALGSLVFHSTVAVSGGREGMVREDDPIEEGGFRNVVEESLARAERMMRAATSLPIVVARAGMLVGDSKTGEIDRLDGFYLLVLLIMTSPRELALPLPSRADAKLNIVPIDFVARAACALASNPRAFGRTVHLVDPHPLPVRRVLDVVAQATGRRMGKGFIPANVTKALLSAPGIDRIARSPRSVLDALVNRVSYDHRNATELLGGTGIECPPFETYVDVLIDAVRRRMDERRERRSAVDDPLV